MNEAEVRALRDENEGLRAENAALRAEVAQVRAENARLTGELTATEGRVAQVESQVAALEKRKTPPPTLVKQDTRPRPAKERSKRAAEQNSGRRRGEPTRIVRHAYGHCPDCGYRLRGEAVARRREVIDIPAAPPVVITEHQVVQRYCPHCEQWQTPQVDWQAAGLVVGQGRIGQRLTALIAYLRTIARLPIRTIQSYLATVHQVTLSVGGICQVLDRLRAATAPAQEELLEQARRGDRLHADETGWREGGQHGYVWSLSRDGPDAIRYYTYDHSRAGEVALRLLGDFRGCLSSDFYAAYHAYHGQHQRCWVHLLRDLHDLREAHPTDATVTTWTRAVQALYDQAQEELDRPRPQPLGEAERKAWFLHFEERARTLGLVYAPQTDHPCHALAHRLLRHHGELFQFVRLPDVSPDNNLAERSLRPLVISRKISGGTRSPDGTLTRFALASLFATWIARGLNPFIELLALLRQPDSFPQV